MSHRGGGPEGEIYRGDDFWPGLYTLVVTSGQTLAMVEGIEVRAGEVARDPRVSPLDLSGRLRLLRFRVESEAGFPIQKIDFVVEEDKVPTRRSRDALAGRYEILARAGSTRFAVGAYGFRPVPLSWFPEEQKVVLRPGIRVRFRSVPKGDMEDPRPGLAGLHSLGLSWIYEGPSGPGIEADLLRHLGRGSHWNLDGRDIVLELPFPGRYRLSLQADLYRPTKNMTVDLPRSSPGVVVVEDRRASRFSSSVSTRPSSSRPGGGPPRSDVWQSRQKVFGIPCPKTKEDDSRRLEALADVQMAEIDDRPVDILIRQDKHQADSPKKMTRSPANTLAANLIAERTCSSRRWGYDFSNSSMLQPSPSRSSRCSTVRRVPLMTGLPIITFGSCSM